MTFIEDDGGRAAAGYRGYAGDCFTRAVAIATGLPYQTIYDMVNVWATTERPRNGKNRSNARTGVHNPMAKRMLADMGWVWVPTMTIGSGCRVHVRADELPPGRLILNLSKHYAAFIDGALHDTEDCARDGTRCVYGYWRGPWPKSYQAKP